MSTVVIVRKNNEAAIAADTLTSGPGIKISATYKIRRQKIMRFGDTYLGFVGYCAHQDVFQSLTEKHPEDLNFSNSRNIFETFLKLHPILKDKFYLQSADDDTYESSDMNILIANPGGIYEVNSDRNVMEFEHFWATGSGRNYALGAMHQAYDGARSAREIAVAGVLAATEFDLYSGLPFTVHSVALAHQSAGNAPALI